MAEVHELIPLFLYQLLHVSSHQSSTLPNDGIIKITGIAERKNKVSAKGAIITNNK